MVKEVKNITVHIAPDSELALRLKEAHQEGAPLIIDTAEAIYHLSIGQTEPARHLPTAATTAQSEAGIRQAAGSWKDVDVAAFKAYVAERRRTSGRPSVRL
jgi:hypothetical protein